MKYTVNYWARVDITIKADNPEQAKELAEEELGTHENREFSYAYLSEINYIEDEKGQWI
jgi:hypothetical protein